MPDGFILDTPNITNIVDALLGEDKVIYCFQNDGYLTCLIKND